MAGYILYGKHTAPWRDKQMKWHEADKRFAPLDVNGMRVSKIADAYIYDSKEQAETILNKVGIKPDCIIESRKVKQC